MAHLMNFASFFHAGFECSTHTLRDGRRLDVVASTQHDRFAELDYARLEEVQIRVAREGIRWHLIEQTRGSYDFSTVLPILEASQRRGHQVIWDVLHFGWPDFVHVFDAEWVDAFAEFSWQFARVLKAELSGPAFVTPVNEISFLSWGGGDVASINPYTLGRGAELKRQLVRAAIASSKAIRSELPGSILVSCEPVIHIAGDPNRPDDVHQAEEYRTSMFEAWDMLMGRLAPELGGKPEYVDVIGVNYYDRNQWRNYGATIRRGEPDYRPFREILQEVHARYGLPMFVSETGTEDDQRRPWFAYVCEEVKAAMEADVLMHGICLYPILNHPGWADDRHCRNGLWDYATSDGEREIYRPLADELQQQQKLI